MFKFIRDKFNRSASRLFGVTVISNYIIIITPIESDEIQQRNRYIFY